MYPTCDLWNEKHFHTLSHQSHTWPLLRLICSYYLYGTWCHRDNCHLLCHHTWSTKIGSWYIFLQPSMNHQNWIGLGRRYLLRRLSASKSSKTSPIYSHTNVPSEIASPARTAQPCQFDIISKPIDSSGQEHQNYLFLCSEDFQFYPNSSLQNSIVTSLAAAAHAIALIYKVALLHKFPICMTWGSKTMNHKAIHIN